MDRIETVVVGAGVVGLAIARALAQSGREVVLIEREVSFGTQTSSRNSEVIHAGLYYDPGSLKAALCIDGARRLYEYCARRNVAHRRCGKLIVATDRSQAPALERIRARATACGAGDLPLLDGSALRSLEPRLQAETALWSASTGIVDSHALMRALLGDAQDRGASLAVASAFVGAEPCPEGFVLRIAADAAELRVQCRELINAGGLSAQSVARAITGLAAEEVPPLYLAKGHYFALRGRSPFSRLIYPLPNEAGLGVHLTLDLAGQARFGPDVEWVSAIDYAVDASRVAAFEPQIRAYWPSLPADGLVPAYAGIRPKLVGAGEPAADFRIDGPERHGVAGLVNLFGIESPGLTASLAIAAYVRELLDRAR